MLDVIGSFVGGFLGFLLFRRDSGQGAFQASGVVGSVLGAIIALLLWRRVGARSRSLAR